METLGGVLVGLLAGGFFYIRAGQQLKNEAEELRKLTALILRGLEQAGIMRLNRGDDGAIVGMVVQLAGSAVGMSSGKATGTVRKGSERSTPE